MQAKLLRMLETGEASSRRYGLRESRRARLRRDLAESAARSRSDAFERTSTFGSGNRGAFATAARAAEEIPWHVSAALEHAARLGARSERAFIEACAQRPSRQRARAASRVRRCAAASGGVGVKLAGAPFRHGAADFPPRERSATSRRATSRRDRRRAALGGGNVPARRGGSGFTVTSQALARTSRPLPKPQSSVTTLARGDELPEARQ